MRKVIHEIRHPMGLRHPVQRLMIVCTSIFIKAPCQVYMNESWHIWMNHVTYEWGMSVVDDLLYLHSVRVFLKDLTIFLKDPCSVCMHESWHKWISHGTYEWAMSNMNESRHIWMSHVMYECVTRESVKQRKITWPRAHNKLRLLWSTKRAHTTPTLPTPKKKPQTAVVRSMIRSYRITHSKDGGHSCVLRVHIYNMKGTVVCLFHTLILTRHSLWHFKCDFIV